jgi:hypothetical protein
MIQDDDVLKAFQNIIEWYLEETDFGEPLKRWEDSSQEEKDVLLDSLVLMGVLNKDDLGATCSEEELTVILKDFLSMVEFTDYITDVLEEVVCPISL